MTTYGVLTPPVGSRDHSAGRADAPITMVQYGDFECPYSGRAFLTVKKLQESLPDGFLFVYRHFPIVPKHKHAQQAAEASEAAGVQGRFWEYHDLLYRHQDRLDLEDLVRYAGELRLDIERFKNDLSEHAFADRVHEDRESGSTSGVHGTPTFFIDGEIYEGFYDYRELFEALARKTP